MPENLNLKIGTMKQIRNSPSALSRDSAHAYDPPKMLGSRPMTMENVLKWIDEMDLDPYIKKEVIKTVSRYPSDAVHKFVQKFKQHLARIHKQKKDLYEEKKPTD